MSESRQYMLMEVVGDGPKFKDKYDSWLCLYRYWPVFLSELFDGYADEFSLHVKFTVIEMTDDEHAAYCEEHEIEWE